MPASRRMTGSGGDTYRPGDFKRICDRTGFEVYASETRREWTGMIVRSEDWEPRHPQDFVRGRPDRQAVPSPRPESPDVFIGVNGNLWDQAGWDAGFWAE